MSDNSRPARARIKIAHHRARRDQHLNRSGQRANQTREAVQRDGTDQHRLATVAVRQRAVEDLADGEADQIGGDGDLAFGRGGAEQTHDVRQRRQIHGRW